VVDARQAKYIYNIVRFFQRRNNEVLAFPATTKCSSSSNPLHKIRLLPIPLLQPLVTQLHMLTPHLFPSLLCSFLVADFRSGGVLDLEDTVDFFERKARGLDVEEPDDGDPAEVEDGEDDVEAPLDGFDAWQEWSVVPIPPSDL
jgi:hypothetical protein